MRFLSKRSAALLCAGLGTVGAASAFTFGATSAEFTSQAAPQTNTITDGTVVLNGHNGGSLPALNIPVLNPGDAYCNPGYFPGGSLCPGGQKPTGGGTLYALDYNGTSDAFVGMDVTVSSTAAKACTTANGAATTIGASQASVASSTVTADCTGPSAIGTLPVFDGDAAAIDLVAGNANTSGNPEQFPLLTDSDFDNAATCSTDANSVVTCQSTIKNVELNSLGGQIWQASAPSSNRHVDIAVSVALPLTATNAVQGSGATLTLTGHAVQSANNLASKVSGQPNTATCDVNTFLPSVDIISGGSNCPASW